MKSKRQRKILEIITENEIDTQEEIALRLKNAGFNVTQATVSRDIREMCLTKAIGKSGRQCYVIPVSRGNRVNEKYVKILKEGYASSEIASNLVVIKTAPGIAMAVAASLDSMEWREIVGCIAGDDTVFCAAHSYEEATKVKRRIQGLIDV